MSEHLFAWRTTTTARLTDDAEAMGNDLDPVLCTVGPATVHRRPHAIQLLGRLFPTDLPSPAGPTFRLSATELLPFRERVQDGIGMPGAMAAGEVKGDSHQIGGGECRLGRDIHGLLPRYPSFVNFVAVTFSPFGCTHAALESTGVYRRPVFNLLEGVVPHLLLVNAQHVKHVPGRKTDVKDAERLAEFLQHGLLRASFVPGSDQRELAS